MVFSRSAQDPWDLSPISLWDATAVEEEVQAAPFEGDFSTDALIVGGGFTGLSTALHAAELGIECHVLEAKQIGYGGSGRNAGLVNAGLWLPPQNVRQQMGEDRGARLIKVLAEAPEYVQWLIERHQIRCEATRTGTIHAAHSPKGLANLQGRAAEWQRLGAPVELLSREQAARMIGTDAFFGGLLDHRAGTLNPMGYVRGLARAAVAAGARLSTGVTARSIERVNDRWVVTTDHGKVSANAVVLGTNAYTDQLWPGLRGTFTPIHYFQLATRPLGARVAGILEQGQGLWDTGSIMFSLRRDAHDRIIIGSMGKIVGGKIVGGKIVGGQITEGENVGGKTKGQHADADTALGVQQGLSVRWAARRLRALFPQLGPVEFEAAWHGQIAMTPDHLPRIHRLGERLYTAIGYNGRGVTTGTICGRALAQLLASGAEADLPLPVTEPRRVASAPVMSRLYQMAFTANQFVKSL